MHSTRGGAEAFDGPGYASRASEIKASPRLFIVEYGAADEEDVAGGAVGLSFAFDGCPRAIVADVDTKIQPSTEIQRPFESIIQSLNQSSKQAMLP